MKNNLQITPAQMINASLLFFVTFSVQVGVGIHGFQRAIYEDAKQDAWISIIISFLFTYLVVFVMFKNLEKFESDDIYGVHQEVFGKFLGNLINIIIILYCVTAFLAIIKNYTEVIITWVFPNLSPWFIVITLLFIVFYAFTGGLRVMVGVCFLSFFLTLWIPVVLIYPMEYTHPDHLLPILDNNLIDILKGAYSMNFTIAGFEVLNVLYPYVKEKEKARKYVYLGLLSTLLLYLFTFLITLTFFSGEQLEQAVWATLSMFSIIRLPFFERIEIFTICFWMVIILPNLCLYAWCAYRGFNRIFNMSDKKFICIFPVSILIGCLFVQSRSQLNTLNDLFGLYAFYLVFIYPFVLYFFISIKRKFSKQQVKKS